mmetsp:Transcript_23645/g.50610  ORF Transcript_23645/g.50610 Transcript_23645/m.50610 type:complete len:208 (-) Transcript_23645:675-1298(-)
MQTRLWAHATDGKFPEPCIGLGSDSTEPPVEQCPHRAFLYSLVLLPSIVSTIRRRCGCILCDGSTAMAACGGRMRATPRRHAPRSRSHSPRPPRHRIRPPARLSRSNPRTAAQKRKKTIPTYSSTTWERYFSPPSASSSSCSCARPDPTTRARSWSRRSSRRLCWTRWRSTTCDCPTRTLPSKFGRRLRGRYRTTFTVAVRSRTQNF